MNIHIIRSQEISDERFQAYQEQLTLRPGPVQFLFSKSKAIWNPDDFIPVDGVDKLPWQCFWKKCDAYRAKKKIKESDVVVLLTDHPDLNNWFSKGEGGAKRNYFIHTDWWEAFVESDSVYPVVYELASVPLLYEVYQDYEDVVAEAHVVPRGCYLDMCGDKRDIHLKMRTADICPDCRREFGEKRIDPSLVRQVLSIYEDVRMQMLYRERYELLSEPSQMNVDEEDKKLWFLQVHPAPVKLTPQEMAVYALFLNHPKGVYFSDLVNHKTELYYLYMNISGKVMLSEFKNSVDNLVKNPIRILNPVINHINGKITEKVGDRIDKHYHILSAGGPHRIMIDREKYVFYTGRFKFHSGITIRETND